jgi:hypothetical protein
MVGLSLGSPSTLPILSWSPPSIPVSPVATLKQPPAGESASGSAFGEPDLGQCEPEGLQSPGQVFNLPGSRYSQ